MIFTAEKLPDCHRQLSIQTCGENIRFYYELGGANTISESHFPSNNVLCNMAHVVPLVIAI
jgi:hypothetical protein